MPRVIPVMTIVLAKLGTGYGLIVRSLTLRTFEMHWNDAMPIGTDNSIGPGRRAIWRSAKGRSMTNLSSRKH